MYDKIFLLSAEIYTDLPRTLHNPKLSILHWYWEYMFDFQVMSRDQLLRDRHIYTNIYMYVCVGWVEVCKCVCVCKYACVHVWPTSTHNMTTRRRRRVAEAALTKTSTTATVLVATAKNTTSTPATPKISWHLDRDAHEAFLEQHQSDHGRAKAARGGKRSERAWQTNRERKRLTRTG